MARWFWLKAGDGSYDARAELRSVRVRSRYDAALLVTRLTNAQEFGPVAVDEDRLVGSRLWFYRSGDEGIFYLLERTADGTDTTIVWAGSLRRTGFGELYAIAERRVANMS